MLENGVRVLEGWYSDFVVEGPEIMVNKVMVQRRRKGSRKYALSPRTYGNTTIVWNKSPKYLSSQVSNTGGPSNKSPMRLWVKQLLKARHAGKKDKELVLARGNSVFSRNIGKVRRSVREWSSGK